MESKTNGLEACKTMLENLKETYIGFARDVMTDDNLTADPDSWLPDDGYIPFVIENEDQDSPILSLGIAILGFGTPPVKMLSLGLMIKLNKSENHESQEYINYTTTGLDFADLTAYVLSPDFEDVVTKTFNATIDRHYSNE